MQRRRKKFSADAEKTMWQIVTEDRMLTYPNLLTLIRILSVPFIGYYIYLHQLFLVLVIGIPSAFTDAFDGWVARKFNQKSELGRVLDPLADKFMAFGVALSMCLGGYIPLWFFCLVFSRDFLISMGGMVLIKKGVKKIPESRILGKITFTVVMLTFLFHLFAGWEIIYGIKSLNMTGDVIYSLIISIPLGQIKHLFLISSCILIIVSFFDYAWFFIKQARKW